MDHPTKNTHDQSGTSVSLDGTESHLSTPFATEPLTDGKGNPSRVAKKGPNVYKPIKEIEAEEVEMYREDGFHPVKLGDRLHNDFEVVAKLGHGGFGTVWLCQEGPEVDGRTEWKAVKIIAACESHEDNPELKTIQELQSQGVTRAQWEAAGVMLPSRHFWIQGPNGTHLCLVFPVMGPNLRSQLEASGETIKTVLAQAGRSLQFLHAHGICHGDFRSDNILLHVNDVEKLSKKEMLTLLEEPRTEAVTLADGSEPLEGGGAPEYLVERSDIGILGPKTQTATIDFGISYRAGDPPEFVGIPAQWAAPEAFFRTGNTGEASDVWSFICMIQEIRGRGEFFSNITRPHYVLDLEALLGPLPDSYRLAWKLELQRDGVFEDSDEEEEFEVAEDGTATKVVKPVSATAEDLKDIRDDVMERSGYADYLQAMLGADRGSIQYQRDVDYVPTPTYVPWRILEEEVFQLADLCEKVLKYDPDERISIEEVMEHEWFKGVFEEVEKTTGKEGKAPETEEKEVTTVEPTSPLETSETDNHERSTRKPPSSPPNNGTATSASNEKDATARKPPVLPVLQRVK
ncbi:serine/threonine-protein kinase SRPK3 [Apiospora rasikravindrae]|uniref:EKC/KEOPS complex subunit BUD32 n=1 Tax=Apiospora rasikravindrae TaxID=990691 RepID=A0ABR1TER7_9PEZI